MDLCLYPNPTQSEIRSHGRELLCGAFFLFFMGVSRGSAKRTDSTMFTGASIGLELPDLRRYNCGEGKDQ